LHKSDYKLIIVARVGWIEEQNPSCICIVLKKEVGFAVALPTLRLLCANPHSQRFDCTKAITSKGVCLRIESTSSCLKMCASGHKCGHGEILKSFFSRDERKCKIRLAEKTRESNPNARSRILPKMWRNKMKKTALAIVVSSCLIPICHSAIAGEQAKKETPARVVKCVLEISDFRSIPYAGDLENVTYLEQNWCLGAEQCDEFKGVPRFTVEEGATACEQLNPGWVKCSFNAPTDLTIEYEQSGVEISLDTKFTGAGRIIEGTARQKMPLQGSSMNIIVKSTDDCPSAKKK